MKIPRLYRLRTYDMLLVCVYMCTYVCMYVCIYVHTIIISIVHEALLESKQQLSILKESVIMCDVYSEGDEHMPESLTPH